MIVPVRSRFIKGMQVEIERLLPGPGRILVQQGDKLGPDDMIGEAEISDGVREIDFSRMFGVSADRVPEILTKARGEVVYRGEPLAKFSKLMGLKTQVYISPIDGIIDNIENGVVTLRFTPTQIKVMANFAGSVTGVNEGQSILISTSSAQLGGVVGFGEQRFGRIKVVGKEKDFLLPQDITADATDKIVIGGALATADTIEKAAAIGVRGLIVGGLNFHETTAWGKTRELGITIIALEGFGFHHLDEDLMDELKKLDDHYACILGSEAKLQIAVEDVGPHTIDSLYRELKVNERVRVVTGEHLGRIGEVEKISHEAQKLESGLLSFIVTVKSGSEVLSVPPQNLEIIEVKR